jgi:hypothetical protein
MRMLCILMHEVKQPALAAAGSGAAVMLVMPPEPGVERQPAAVVIKTMWYRPSGHLLR